MTHKEVSSRGGKARAKALTAKKRKEIASKGGKAAARKQSLAARAARKAGEGEKSLGG